MAKNVVFFAWMGALVSPLILAEIFSYIRASDSNHTAFEPRLLTVVFVPTIVAGAVALRRKLVMAGAFAILLGLTGLVTLAYIDRTNTMLQYDRWLSRNMPLPRR